MIIILLTKRNVLTKCSGEDVRVHVYLNFHHNVQCTWISLLFILLTKKEKKKKREKKYRND